MSINKKCWGPGAGLTFPSFGRLTFGLWLHGLGIRRHDVDFWWCNFECLNISHSQKITEKISTEGLSLTHRSTCTCISEDWKHCYKFLPRPDEFWLANAATYNPENTRDLSIYSTRGRGLLSRWAPLPWVMLKDTSKA